MEYISKYSIKEKIGAAILATLLLFGTASSAMAMSNVTKKNYKTAGDVWWYSLANSTNDVGAWNRTDYYNPKQQHCTKLKSNGAWRTPIVADRGKHAHDESKNNKRLPWGSNGAVASRGNCLTFYAPSVDAVAQNPGIAIDSANISGDSTSVANGNRVSE